MLRASGRGGACEEDLGVPPLQGVAHSGPLGPELGTTGALGGEQSDTAVLALVVGVPHPFKGAARRSWRHRTPGHSPRTGAKA